MESQYKKDPKSNDNNDQNIRRSFVARHKTLLIVLGSIIVIILVVVLLLPEIILNSVNKKLGHLKEYRGHVEDINIHLLQGAVSVYNFELSRRNKKGLVTDTIPFVKVERVSTTIDWRMIFKGVIVAKVIIQKPVVKYVLETHKGEKVKKDTSDINTLKSMMPLKLNLLEIDNGEMHFIDYNVKPNVNILVSDIYISGTNLTNIKDTSNLLPAKLSFAAKFYGGEFKMNADANLIKKYPTFQMKSELKGLNMVNLNDFFKAYGNFDIKKGSFSLITEFAAKNGQFGGYIKPYMKDFEVTGWKKEESLGDKLWKSLIGTGVKILENKKTNAVTSKVPINGSFENANTNIWEAISLVLRNAFIKALRPSFDNTISIRNLKEKDNKTFLEKVFGSGDNNEKKGTGDKKDKKDKKSKIGKEKKNNKE